VANDYGRLSAADKARLKRARKRAGVSKPTPPPVRGENAREKARVPVQARARKNFERMERGEMSPANFARSIAGLEPSEKRDLGSYSKARSERTQDKAFKGMVRRTPGAFVEPFDRAAGVGLSFNPKSEGFVSELKSIVHGAKYAKNVLMDPDSSRAEKRNAALGVTSMAGLGGGVGRSGKPKPKATATGELSGDDILGALPAARRKRAAQEKGYREERAARAERAAAARAAAGGGEAGRIAAKAEFKGELEKLSFDTLMKRYGESGSAERALFQPQVDARLNQIATHPSMKGQYSIEGTQNALMRALDGVTPTKSEIRKLEAVFGDEAVEYFRWAASKEKALKALNLPRSLQATFDLSRALRQDIMVLPRHPRMWAKNWKVMVNAARNEDKAKDLMTLIHNDPDYDDAIEHGLALTEIGGATKKLEEDMIGVEYAEKIPVLGKGVKFANRGYAVGGSMQRLQLYKLHLKNAEASGKALTKKDKRQLASVVNAMTGRGNMGHDALEKAAPLLTMGFFSPRLIAARVAFMNPIWYAKLYGHPLTKPSPAFNEAVSAMALFVSAGTATLAAAAQIPGVDVGLDPRSADYGKIRVGDTRIDIWGGFQQYVVNFERFRRGEKVSSMTGEVTEQKPSETTIDFFRNKLAPLPGYAWNAADKETSGGQPFDRVSGAGKLFIPLNWQNTYAAAKEDPGAGAASFGLGFFGVGTNTYSSDPEQVAEAKKRMRGPLHIRNHEDRVSALRKEWKANNLPNDPKAVEASRAIRNMDLAKKRAEKKKGDKLTSQEKARLAFRTHRRLIPEGISTWQANFANARTEDEWQSFYEELRQEIAEPFKYYGVGMEPSED
jgi:hypothetical protein